MLDATWWHMVFSPSIHLYMTASVMSLGTLNQKIHEDWIAVQELARQFCRLHQAAVLSMPNKTKTMPQGFLQLVLAAATETTAGEL